VGALSVDQAFLFAVARDAFKIATSSLASARSALSFVSGIRPASERSEPERGLVSFFKNNCHFGEKFRPGTSATNSAVIRNDRCSGSQQLIADYSGLNSCGKGAGQADDAKSELLSSILQCVRTLPQASQSKINIQKSTINNNPLPRDGL